MTFTPEHCRMILDRVKTQTRRLDRVYIAGLQRPLLYQVGRIYAVQPGRGKPAVGHIRILSLDRQMVREVTNLQARAEGYDTVFHFWQALDTVNNRAVKGNEWVTAYAFELVEQP